MSDIAYFLNTQTPTAKRPLLGLTVLLVEDSQTACEAMRLMCLRSGARIRRADCLESARRHLRVYRPNVVISDMGLPDGSGAELIRDLDTATPRVEAVIGLSADPLQEGVAIDAGANGFIEKPLGSIAAFQSAVLKFLPSGHQPFGPRAVNNEEVQADPIALQEDLALAQNLLTGGEQTADTKTYLATFLSGVASTANDTELAEVAANFAKARAMVGPEKAKLQALLNERLCQKVAI
ncbi:MAG: response regulator [Planktomarina sp.]